MSKFEKLENAKAKLTASIDSEVWVKAQKDAFNKLAKKVEIKGFRKGSAPAKLVKQYISEQSVLLEAAESVAQGALEAALEEHNVELIDRPTLDIDTINANECTLSFVCPVKPDVELGDYKSIEYAPKKVSVKAAEVEDELKRIQEQKAELELKEDGAVENGDTAVIDFEGFKDGVAFEGGKGENYDLVIGSGSFIPGFEEQLIGMKAEEEKEINVTFPEQYQSADLAGKAATFKVKVHEIKKKVLPELTEELIAELKYEGVKTLEDLKAHIKKNIKTRKENEAENEATNELMDKLSDGAKVEIPAVMVENEAQNMLNDYQNQMMSQGIDMDTYFKITGSTKEKFMEMLKPDAEKKVKIQLVLEEIFKAEKLEVSAEDIKNEFAKLSEMYGMDVETLKKYITEAQVKGDLALRKAIEFVKKH